MVLLLCCPSCTEELDLCELSGMELSGERSLLCSWNTALYTISKKAVGFSLQLTACHFPVLPDPGHPGRNPRGLVVCDAERRHPCAAVGD